MDFEDTKEEAAFRADANKWLSANAKLRGSKSSKDDFGGDGERVRQRHDREQGWQKKKGGSRLRAHHLAQGLGRHGRTPIAVGSSSARKKANTIVATGAPFAIGLGMCIPTLMTYGNDDAQRALRLAGGAGR